MITQPNWIPRPLVRINQWFIVISVLFTWLTNLYGFLALPIVSGLIGLLFGVNPVIHFFKKFLKDEPSHYFQENATQQQFNQTIAVSLLILALISYIQGWIIAAYICSALVAIAAFVAIMGFCVGCFIHFQWNQYMHRRSRRKQ